MYNLNLFHYEISMTYTVFHISLLRYVLQTLDGTQKQELEGLLAGTRASSMSVVHNEYSTTAHILESVLLPHFSVRSFALQGELWRGIHRTLTVRQLQQHGIAAQ